MFLIRYIDAVEGQKVYRLAPMPTEVNYPEGDLISVQASPDNNVVIQRPLRDNRPRKWIWKNYRSTVPLYEDQYQQLRLLTAKSRWKAGDTETTVEIWEDESGIGSFGEISSGTEPDQTTYSNQVWTRVRISNVYRTNPQNGGPPTYPETLMEFYIEDSSYSDF